MTRTETYSTLNIGTNKRTRRLAVSFHLEEVVSFALRWCMGLFMLVAMCLQTMVVASFAQYIEVNLLVCFH